jgi:hypothetical protein
MISLEGALLCKRTKSSAFTGQCTLGEHAWSGWRQRDAAVAWDCARILRIRKEP